MKIRAGDSILPLALAVPHTYMNESGLAVARLAKRYVGGDPTKVVIVHDELDLPPGELKVKQGGGIAGHNGLRSVEQHLHSRDFIRVRIGVGKPPGKTQGVNHVLRKPGKAELELILVAVEEAADAVEMLLTSGVAATMNQYNTRSA